MEQGDVLTVMRETILTILKLGAPMLILSIVVGLVIAIFQAATQIHEQTLTFVPKLVAILLVLLLGGSWMLSLMSDLFGNLFEMMARL